MINQAAAFLETFHWEKYKDLRRALGPTPSPTR